MGIALITIGIEVTGTRQSLHKLGPIEGIESVGVFYVDPTLIEDEQFDE